MPCFYKYDSAPLESSYLNVLYLAIIQYAKMAAILHTVLWACTVMGMSFKAISESLKLKN